MPRATERASLESGSVGVLDGRDNKPSTMLSIISANVGWLVSSSTRQARQMVWKKVLVTENAKQKAKKGANHIYTKHHQRC
jgi:hypothetical protein